MELILLKKNVQEDVIYIMQELIKLLRLIKLIKRNTKWLAVYMKILFICLEVEVQKMDKFYQFAKDFHWQTKNGVL